MDIALRKQESISYKRRKTVAVFTTLLIVLTLLFALSTTVAKADFDWEGFFEEIAFFNPQNCAEGYVDVMKALMSGELINYMTNFLFSSDAVDTFLSVVTPGSSEQTSAFGSGVFDTITAALKSIALFMCFFYSLDNLLKEVNKGELTEESALRIFLYFIIPAILILNYNDIFLAFKTVGDWITGLMNKATIGVDFEDAAADSVGSGRPFPEIDWSGNNIKAIARYIGDIVDFFINSLIPTLLLILLYFIVDLIVVVIICTNVINVYVELILRSLFMPLAIANVNHEGMRSAGFRYIKKFFGCFLKIGSIFITVNVAFYVYCTLINLDGVNDLHRLIFLIVLIPAVKTALKMVNQIIDDGLGTSM